MVDSQYITKSRAECRAILAVLGVVALLGLALGWNLGQLPRHEPSSAVAAPAATNEEQIAPDLALYRDVIADVRRGEDYYEAARRRIPAYGFPISSPLNWRLPTYAWLFSRLPGLVWIQAALALLSAAGLALAFSAHRRSSGIGYAALTTFLLFGVVRWAIDGHAYLAQEPWAAALLVVALAAHAKGGEPGQSGWRFVAIGAGIAALFFRELALPFCGVALLVAAWHCRWREAGGWAIGVAAFFAFFAWHVSQVKLQLAGTDVAAGAGLSQWLRLGGLDFVLLTTRMNSLLFAAPAALLWLYVLLSLVGLASRRDETSALAGWAALAYLLAFAVVGRPENFYWGLMPAPLLAFGAAFGPRAILARLNGAGQNAYDGADSSCPPFPPRTATCPPIAAAPAVRS